MRVCITLEHRFERTPDGAVWTRSNHSYAELKRYLEVFDEVRVLARVRENASRHDSLLRADGDRVRFWTLPYYVGFGEFCARWRSVQRAAEAAVEGDQAVILKAPSMISCLVEIAMRAKARPFAVEVCGDPRDVYGRGSLDHPLRPFFRHWFTHRTSKQCRRACAVSYVTRHTLQSRYPASRQFSVSDVMLPADVAPARRAPPVPPAPICLITVGSLEQPYKGTDTLIDALAISIRAGLNACLTVVGGGKYQSRLAAQAERLGVGQRVDFKGALPAGEKVFAELDRSDLFVLPSRTEGLPRAMIEAMARGLPCIGSTAGGIPELLDADCLVPPADAPALSARLLEVAASPGRLAQMSRNGLERAREFTEARLAARRREFLTAVREATGSWRMAS